MKRIITSFKGLMAYPVKVSMMLPVIIAMVLSQGIQIGRVDSVTNQVKHGLLNQTHNRAKNVSIWCGSINDLQTSLEAYVAKFPHVPPLALKQLDCGKLEQATVQSAKPSSR